MTVTAMPPRAPEDLLVAAVDALAAEQPADLPPAASLARTRVLMVQRERIDALLLRGLSDVDTRQLHALENQPSTTAWVQAQRVPGVDGRDVALARQLQTVPTIAAEREAGRLSSADAAELTTAVRKARPFLDKPDGLIDGMDAEAALYGVLVDGVLTLLAEQTGGATPDDPEQEALRAELEALNDASRPQRERIEACLVLFARRCRPGLLHSGLALLLDALLPAQHEKRAREAADRRGFTLTPSDVGSGWTCRGTLDDETGEMLATVIAAERAVDPEAPLDTNAWRDAAKSRDLEGLAPEHWPAEFLRPRTKAEQRHDALRAALRLLLDTGALGSRGKASPQILVTVGLDFVQGVPGALPARTMYGARLARWQIRELVCRSAFTRMVLDARHRVVEVSHSQRTLTAIERQILHVKWGGHCARNGCCRGPDTGDPLVPHHAQLFSNTGKTSIDDTIPFCKLDHHVLHDDGQTILLSDGRVIGPDGWVEPGIGEVG